MAGSTATFTSETLTQLAKAIGADTANMGEIVKRLTEMGISPKDVDDIVKYAKGDIILSKNGTPLGTQLYRTVQINIPDGIGVDSVVTDVNPKLLDSNTQTLARTSTNRAITVAKDPVTGKLGFRTVAQNVGSRASYVFGAVGSGVAAVSAGMFLGKKIDELLYNANPDFWDSVGMSSLNPQSWRNFVFDEGSLGANLFNFMFGIEDEGVSQAFMDAEALAYMAKWMQEQGIFSSETYATVDPETKSDIDPNNYIGGNIYVSNPITELTVFDYRKIGAKWSDPETGLYRTRVYTFNKPVRVCYAYRTIPASGGLYQGICQTRVFSDTAFSGEYTIYYYSGSQTTSTFDSVSGMTYDGKTVNYLWPSAELQEPASKEEVDNRVPYDLIIPMPELTENGWSNLSDAMNIAAWIGQYGEVHSSSGVDGISNQEGANIPDFSGLDTISDIMDYLSTFFPNEFANAIEVPSIDPNTGEETSRLYVPVPMPNADNYNDTQPTTGNSTQADPEINPNTSLQSIIEGLVQTIQQRTTQPEENPTDPTRPRDNDNPSNTGEGNSPQIVIPTGSASVLWSVYHPSQAQIDSFGAWLWSPSFIDQIAKIFNNPMESIIGLHKVYANPVDAGTSTIHVGYLDSGVSSAYVTQQYVEVDCGTINLYEQFGNVFDYSPFTTVELYLPFVGIVPLSVDDVMRSQISITYGVDVFTGACLAMVDVQRDLGGGILYQYSGNCAVQYPISSGSYMGIVAGIASIAGGVVATIATGGGVAPALLGAAGAAMSMHTDVQHSGSFSGNSGAMGGKVPYLIISRPQSTLYGYEGVIEGLPANAYTTIGQCTGFVKARNVELVGVTATEDELSEIESLLLNGVYV